MIDLRNKAVLITGASSGLGRQCAITCSELGATVALFGRNRERLEETLSLMAGSSHCVVELDLTEFDAIEPVVAEAVRKIGSVSGFVHSAGVSSGLPLKLLRPDQFQKTFAVNVTSGFELAKHIVKRGLIDNHGASFVFIASVMSLFGQPTKTAYCASKAALTGGAKALALEVAAKAVRVNCVSPGVVKTEMYESFAAKLTPEALQNVAQSHPLGLGEPADVAHAVAFLLSDAARWMTGANLVVDGGYCAQ